MCDQTELSYSPGDIVWVKLGPVWWPGKVCSEKDIPPEIMKGLRKEPIAIVKFFQEDTYEYVKKITNIYRYNCFKKHEFIKKGLDMYRSKSYSDRPSNMKLFPEDVATAELLTGGNPDILNDEMFLVEEKPSVANLFPVMKKTPKKMKIETKKEAITIPKQIIPRVITHPRFIKLSLGMSTDYEVRERRQEPARPESDEEDIVPPTTYRCTECDFSTIRLNVIALHYKSHMHNFSFSNIHKKQKNVENRKRLSYANKDSVVKEKISRTTNGAVKSPKSTGRGRKPGRKKEIEKSLIERKETKNTSNISKLPVKRKLQVHSDEFQNALLEDWAEYEMNEQDCGLQDNIEKVDNNETLLSSVTTEKIQDQSKTKSCFDFDDSEDNIIINKPKIKFCRKVSRKINKEPITAELAKESVSLKARKDDILNSEVTSSSDLYKTSLNDSFNESLLNTQQTQLQEMEVVNEVEINSEEVSEILICNTENKNKNNDKTETDTKSNFKCTQSKSDENEEDEQLFKKVDALLEEVSASSKLLQLPNVSKQKMHSKSREILMEDNFSKSVEQNVSENDIEIKDQLVNHMIVDNQTILSENKINNSIEEKHKISDIENQSTNNSDTKIQVCSQTRQSENNLNDENKTNELDGKIVNNEVRVSENKKDTSFSNESVDASDTPIIEENESVICSDDTAVLNTVTAEIPIIETSETVCSSTEYSEPGSVTNLTALSDVSEKDEQISDQSVSSSIAENKTVANDGNIAASESKEVTAKTFTIGSKYLIVNKDARSPTKFIKITNPKQVTCEKTAIHNINKNNLIMLKNDQKTPTVSQAVTSTLVNAKLKSVDGKNIFCSLPQSSSILLAKQPSPQKLIIKPQLKLLNRSNVPTATTSKASTVIYQNRSITSPTLASTKVQNLRLGPGILQKTTIRPTVTPSSIIKTPTKNMISSSSLQSGSVVLLQSNSSKPQLLLTGLSTTEPSIQVVSTASSHSQSGLVYLTGNENSHQVINNSDSALESLNSSININQQNSIYITVENPGNIVNVPEISTTADTCSTKEDILAKALENTDVLQTEEITSANSSVVLDSLHITQNTSVPFKNEIYENVTLNTPPIMSTYETPSRSLSSKQMEVSDEIIIINEKEAEANQYID